MIIETYDNITKLAWITQKLQIRLTRIINAIIAWRINNYHKHEYANRPFYYCLQGIFPTADTSQTYL